MKRDFGKGYYMMAIQDVWPGGEAHEYDTPDLVVIYGEDDEYYVGQYVLGLCIPKTKFPKATTRPLNEDEVRLWSGRKYRAAGISLGKMNITNAKQACKDASTDTIRYEISHSRRGYYLDRCERTPPPDTRVIETTRLIPPMKCRKQFLANFWDLWDKRDWKKRNG